MSKMELSYVLLLEQCGACFHRDVCNFYRTVKDEFPNALTVCKHFCDKSRVLNLPFMVGDSVYVLITKKSKSHSVFTYIQRFRVSEYNFLKFVRDFGKTVFLTEEEAKKELAERRDK